MHLHPFAESIELVDLTAGKSIYKSRARNFEDKIGLEHVDYYSDEKGAQLFKNHEYELVSVYDNTTKDTHDSMAVLNMYALWKNFEKPTR